jgi:ATP/ADP translocase
LLRKNNIDDNPSKIHEQQKSYFGQSFFVIKESRYLLPLFLIVIISQFAVTLVEYELSVYVSKEYTDLDMRTQVMGQMQAIINGLSTLMQLISGPIFKIFSVTGTMIGVPLIITLSILAFVISPQFLTIMLARIVGKTFDYSLIRATKEILYIPLSRNEKTQGKAIIDIFAYRVARGICSILLIVLISFDVSIFAMYLLLGFMMCWIYLAFVVAKRFKALAQKEDDFIFEHSK